MSNPQAYVSELKIIEGEMKRMNAHLKNLRERKKEVSAHLYSYMNERGMEQYGGFSLSKVKPKNARRRKKESEKKEAAIQLFRQAGISNPENFYGQFKESQSYTADGYVPPKRQPKKKKDAYDDLLGF